MSQFKEETQLTQLAEGHWQGRVHSSWNIGENPNGGYLISIVLSAFRQLVPAHPDPLTVTVHYLRPGTGDAPCEVKTQIVRTGRTLTTLRGTLIQDGKERLEVLAGFANLTETDDKPVVLTIPPPDMPSPDECTQRSGEQQGIVLPISQRLDVRLHPEEAGAASAGKAQVRGYIRHLDGTEPDPCSLVLFTDTFPPSVFGLLGQVGWVPTLELTVHVRRHAAPGWILGQFQTHDLGEGRLIEDGILWDSAGHLVAQARQIALVRN